MAPANCPLAASPVSWERHRGLAAFGRANPPQRCSGTYVEAAPPRALKGDKTDALAYHYSTWASRYSFAPATTLLTAAYMTSCRCSTFRFPFYTPKPAWFDPWCFPTGRSPFLVGPSAVRLWQVLRFGAYGTLCHFTARWLIREWAGETLKREAFADKRLTALNSELYGDRFRRFQVRQNKVDEIMNRAQQQPPSWTKPGTKEQHGQQQQEKPDTNGTGQAGARAARHGGGSDSGSSS
ncbi:hypothetical protein C8A05DRAFT_34596 [Staphylotrichum tortipilum]|uniref:Uncharacterized protein n=1 Tax=Staphylotrichum tortipilum TaxID=2831512 RepID=A0AAN6MK73_9PEZI|nr:hypothetical protein C8A05DRAFT_34596 [Staphylotrichum longicolle]